MSILEAMAHSLPIVALDVGGISEIVDNGEDGCLIEKRDPKAFTEKCFLLYKNRQLRRRMARAAREKIVKSFSVENMAAQYHELYLNLNRGLNPNNSLLYLGTQNTVVSRLLGMILNNFIVNPLRIMSLGFKGHSFKKFLAYELRFCR